MDPLPNPQPQPPETQPAAAAAPAALELDAADHLGARMLDQLKQTLGDAWQDRLSPAEQRLIVSVMNDLASMTLLSASTGQTFDAELAQLEAQLATVASIEFERTRHYVFTAAGRVALGGLTWLIRAAGPYLGLGVDALKAALAAGEAAKETSPPA